MAEIITIARPYAQAVFDLAREKNAFDEWSRTLELLSVIVADPRMAAVIGNPSVSSDALANLIIEVSGNALSDQGRSLVRTLAENRRLQLVPEMRALYEAMRAEAEQIVQADVVSAFPLTEEQKKSTAHLRDGRGIDRRRRDPCGRPGHRWIGRGAREPAGFRAHPLARFNIQGDCVCSSTQRKSATSSGNGSRSSIW
jgi:F-type H+-transporting ATPase subunit delta